MSLSNIELSARRDVSTFIGAIRLRGLSPRPVLMPPKIGCRECGEKGGTLFTSVLATELENKIAVVCVASFCRRCHGNEDVRDKALQQAVVLHRKTNR